MRAFLDYVATFFRSFVRSLFCVFCACLLVCWVGCGFGLGWLCFGCSFLVWFVSPSSSCLVVRVCVCVFVPGFRAALHACFARLPCMIYVLDSFHASFPPLGGFPFSAVRRPGSSSCRLPFPLQTQDKAHKHHEAGAHPNNHSRGPVPYAPCPQGCSGHLLTAFMLQRGGTHGEHREQDNTKRVEWRQGGADENACKSEVQASMRSTCRARARMQEGRTRKRGEKKKEGEEKTERPWISSQPRQG